MAKNVQDHGAKVSRPVLANGPTGDTLYRSIAELRAALSLKPPTINRALKSGKPLTRGPYTGWKFTCAQQ
jgi:hypothetical protein